MTSVIALPDGNTTGIVEDKSGMKRGESRRVRERIAVKKGGKNGLETG